MVISVWISLFAQIFIQQEIPLKPKEEFTIDLNYTFKERPATSATTFEYKDGMEVRNRASGPLPHLGFKIKITKAAPEELRYKAINNDGRLLVSGKIKIDDVILIDMGFLDDVKDREKETTYEISLFTLTDKKKEVNRIHILVQEDGTFLVNNEKRGKF